MSRDPDRVVPSGLEHWWEVHVACRSELESAVVARLGRAGCRVLLRDSDSAAQVGLRAYLLVAATPPHAVAALYLALLADAARLGHRPPEVSWREVLQEHWSDEVRQRIQPTVDVGRRLRIQPPWEALPDDDRRIVIQLHPAAAFGNGLHPTTALCLEALEGLFDPHRASVAADLADLGTGSGILAIAAVFLGAQRVCAVDTDVLSVHAARANRDLNGIGADALAVWHGSLDAVAAAANGPVDGVLCNMLAEALLPIVPDLGRITLPGAWAVIGGFRTDQEGDLRQCCEANGWEWSESARREGWACAVVRRG